jgi:hypothetical protein
MATIPVVPTVVVRVARTPPLDDVAAADHRDEGNDHEELLTYFMIMTEAFLVPPACEVRRVPGRAYPQITDARLRARAGA